VSFFFVLANCLATHNSSRVASREFCGRSPKKLPTLRNHKSKCRRVPKEKRKKNTNKQKLAENIPVAFDCQVSSAAKWQQINCQPPTCQIHKHTDNFSER